MMWQSNDCNQLTIKCKQPWEGDEIQYIKQSHRSSDNI